MRPQGTEHLTEAELIDLVTRDSMIGVASLDLTRKKAAAFVCEHGAVLMSGKGPCAPRWKPSSAAHQGQLVGAPHRSRAIFKVLQVIENSPDILVCRLIDAKVTYVHRRLWPHWSRMRTTLAVTKLAQVRQEHTASGRHTSRCIDFPDWVPKDVREAARLLSKEEAARLLAPHLHLITPSGAVKAKRVAPLVDERGSEQVAKPELRRRQETLTRLTVTTSANTTASGPPNNQSMHRLSRIGRCRRDVRGPAGAACWQGGAASLCWRQSSRLRP